MKTTELFDFHFVDRYNEQKVLKNFLSDPMEYVLWIKGERGLGKTEFLNYALKSCKEYELCYVDLKINNSSVDNISNFIVELQKHCNIDFMMFIKKKYKYFYDSNFKNIKELSSQFFPQISNVVSAILNLGRPCGSSLLFLLTRLMRGVTLQAHSLPVLPHYFYSHASCEA